MSSDNNGEIKGSVAEALRIRKEREKGVPGTRIQTFPKICARCGREFSGKRLRELTVHHKDHNHNNNPPDGSNWELLCIYCHDNEHARDQVADAYAAGAGDDIPDNGFSQKTFCRVGGFVEKY